MSILTAIAHIFGGIIAHLACEFGGLILNGLWNDRKKKVALVNASIALGIPVEDLDRTENEMKVIQFSALRFSSDRFSNRLSDLCGWVQLGWVWLGTFLQIGLLLVVIWNTVTNDRMYSLYAWWVIAFAFFFFITAVLFSLACKLLTDRYPGEARQTRKVLAQFIQQHRVIPTYEADES